MLSERDQMIQEYQDVVQRKEEDHRKSNAIHKESVFDMDATTVENIQLKNQMQSYKDADRSLKAEVQLLTRRQTEFSKERNHLEQRAKELETALETIVAACETTKKSLSKCVGQNKVLNEELEMYHKNSSTLKTTMEDFKKQISEGEEAKKYCEEKIVALEGAATAKDGEITELYIKINEQKLFFEEKMARKEDEVWVLSQKLQSGIFLLI